MILFAGSRTPARRRFSSTIIIVLTLGLSCLGSGAAYADSFSDNFDNGLCNAVWSITATHEGLYSTDVSSGDVRFSRPQGGIQENQQVRLNFNFDLQGDFDISFDYRDAQIERVNGTPGNKIQLNIRTGASLYLAVVRSDEIGGPGDNYHVWHDPPAAWIGEMLTTDTAATIRLTRVGTTITAYVDGQSFYSGTYNNETVTSLWMSLGNHGTNDPTSVTFDNFSVTADTIVGLQTCSAMFNAVASFPNTGQIIYLDLDSALASSRINIPGAPTATTLTGATVPGTSTLISVIEPGLSGELLEVDLATQQIINYSPSAYTHGIAVQPFTQEVIVTHGNPGPTRLGLANSATGFVADLGEINLPPSPPTLGVELLAFSPQGELFGAGLINPPPNVLLYLYKIDLRTGNATLLGTPGASYLGHNSLSFIGDELWSLNQTNGNAIQLSTTDGSVLDETFTGIVGLSGLAALECTQPSEDLIAKDVPNDGGGEIQLDWSSYVPAGTVLNYDIFRAIDPCDLTNGTASQVGTVGGTTTTFIDDTVSDYTTYFYKVEVWGIGNFPDDILYSDLAFSFPNILISEFAPSGGVTPKGGKIGELVELRNQSSDPIDLTGWLLSNGPGDPTPDTEPVSGIIPAGGLFVHSLVSIDLPDAGGTLELLPPTGGGFQVDAVSYGTEGGAPSAPPGFTIQRVEGSDPDDPDAENFETGPPSIGEPNPVPAPALGVSVLINEVYHMGGAGEDYVEIINPLPTTLVLDQFQIADGSGFLDTLPAGITLGPGQIFMLDASSPDPFLRDLTNSTLYLYQITESGFSQRIDQVGWGASTTDPPAPIPIPPNDSVVRAPDGIAAYLGDQGANWLDSGGDLSLFYGPQSPGAPNITSTTVVFSVDPLGGGDFTTIGTALAAAVPGVTILIEPATYNESINLVDGVELLGNTVGTEQVFIVGDGVNPAVTGTSLGSSTRLRNLVIQSATGGMVLTNSSVTCSNVKFLGNQSTGDGAGVIVDGGAPYFSSCLFKDNVSRTNGGAVHIVSGNPDFDYCMFVNNDAVGMGAAIYQIDGTTFIENSVFDLNGSYGIDGGTIHAMGGGIAAIYSTMTNGKSGVALRNEGGGNVVLSCGLLNNYAEDMPGGEPVFLSDVIEDQDPQFCQPLALNYAHNEASPLTGLAGTCDSSIGVAGPPCGTVLTNNPPAPRTIDSQLHPPIPNPFNPATTLRFELGSRGSVRLEIYDARGRRVATPVLDAALPAGPHEVTWHGLDTRNRRVASGVYFARLKLNGETVGRVQRLVLLK